MIFFYQKKHVLIVLKNSYFEKTQVCIEKKIKNIYNINVGVSQPLNEKVNQRTSRGSIQESYQ